MTHRTQHDEMRNESFTQVQTAGGQWRDVEPADFGPDSDDIVDGCENCGEREAQADTPLGRYCLSCLRETFGVEAEMAARNRASND